MLGSLGSIVLVATMGGANRGRSFLAAGMFLFATLGFIIVQIDRQRKQRAQQVTGSRTEYLRYLSNIRKVARDAADQQRRALNWHHPEPTALPSLAEDRTRLWEHGPTDDNYLHVRYGLCSQPLSLELVPPESAPVDQVDPAAASALHRLLVVHRLQPNLPASIDLRAFDRIELCGDAEEARSAARAMICSATAFHNPDQLVVAVLSSEQNLTHWDWVKWLPHAQSARESDAVGPMRLVSTSLDDLGQLLPPDLSERPRFGADERAATPHILLVIDGGQLPPGNHIVPPDGLHGVTLLDLPHRWDELEDSTRLRLEFVEGPDELDKRPVLALRLRDEPIKALADQCDLATAEAFARRMAPLKTATTESSAGGAAVDITSTTPDHMELLGLGDIHAYDTTTAWRPRPARDRLRVPIGVGDSGGLIHLDIKESAQRGHGPARPGDRCDRLGQVGVPPHARARPGHDPLVGTAQPGAGRLQGRRDLRRPGRHAHTSRRSSPTSPTSCTLVDRMQDALSGEMTRRQELLREAGNYASIRDYEKARANGEPLEPLPSLFIVVDEFSEMLSAKPDFIDLFVADRSTRPLAGPAPAARLATPGGGPAARPGVPPVLPRSACAPSPPASPALSWASPTPTSCPAVPGLGYLKPDQSTLLRFKAAYVSGPPSSRARVTRDEGGAIRGILPFTISEVQALAPVETDSAEVVVPVPQQQGEQPSLLDVAVQRMIGKGPEAHQVWLPPLDVPDTLDELLPDLVEHPDLGLVSQQWRNVPGLVDPARHRRPPARAAPRHHDRSTSPARPATSPSSAVPARARARSCAPSWPAWRW